MPGFAIVQAMTVSVLCRLMTYVLYPIICSKSFSAVTCDRYLAAVCWHTL